MRKVLMFMALASFLTASVTTSKACGDDKACAAKGKKASMSCCTKGAKASTAVKGTMDPNCKVKNGKDCSKDPNCVKEMSSKKSMKNCCAKDANKKS